MERFTVGKGLEPIEVLRLASVLIEPIEPICKKPSLSVLNPLAIFA